MFLRIFQHLLPRAKAWLITTDKYLRQFFEGLTGIGEDIKEHVDLIYLDLLPQHTRALDEWEDQFNLPDTGLTTQERRDRLDATWAALGGQSIKYIQDTLQANGFTVYIHEWFDPATIPAVNVKSCVTPRDPTLLSNLEMLANKITTANPTYLACAGEALMEAGEATALAGNYSSIVFSDKVYAIPPTTGWPYIFYVGGATYGTSANVDANREDEFKALIMKLKPAQQWAGLMINYV